MEYNNNSFTDKVEIPKEMYDRIYKLVREFDSSTDDPGDEDYLSDGEWLDLFFNMCLEITFAPMIKELTRWNYVITPRKIFKNE